MESTKGIADQHKTIITKQLQDIWDKDTPFSIQESIDHMITCIECGGSIDGARDIYAEFGYTKQMYMAIGLLGSQEQKDLFEKYWSMLK